MQDVLLAVATALYATYTLWLLVILAGLIGPVLRAVTARVVAFAVRAVRWARSNPLAPFQGAPEAV